MAEITLAAELRTTLGSAATRRLRRDAKVPGVVYGHGSEPVPVAVAARELRTALSGESGTNTLLELQAGDQSFLTVAREMQHHPVRGTVIHVDFQVVRRDEVIGADVPVVLVGEALEVHHGDGLVEQQLFTLPIHALPSDIPHSVEVDISELTIGATIRVADLPLPAGVTADLEDEAPVAVGQPPRVQAAGEGEGAEGEGAAGEAAAAPEGGAGESAEGEA